MLVAAWFAAVAAGLAVVVRYDSTPAHAADEAPATWPAESSIVPTPGRATLLVFLHPKCPCSRTTVTELEKILTRDAGRSDVRVLFVAPPGAPDDWSRVPLRARAEDLPGVVVSDDAGAVEAARFHATTSGAVVLYGADGRLLYAGGITLSRGHEGDNPGRDAVAALLADGGADSRRGPVFGCPLSDAPICPSPAATDGEPR